MRKIVDFFARRPKTSLIIVALVGLLVFLLYPLGSPQFRIVFDESKIKAKKEYLELLKTIYQSRNFEQRDYVRRPNIVLIVADDLAWSDVSLQGNSLVPTPNIDGIAKRGAQLTEGYITSPICSPSRAGLLTGRYQQRFGYEYQPHARYPNNRLEYYVYKWFIARGDWRVSDRLPVPQPEDMLRQGLPPTEIILPELLKNYDYSTAIIGKWHLGTQHFTLPLQRGFDYHYGFYEAYSLYYADTSGANVINQRHTDFSDKFIWGKGRTGNCAIYKNTQVVQDSTYLTHKIADEAVNFIHENREKPFFLYVPFLAPHTPFQVPKETFDKYGHIADRNKRVYCALIDELDRSVGKIRDAISSHGLDENTIIIFLSDNGGARYTGAVDNAPFKGGKFSNFEGGLRVPFFIEWKGQIPANTIYTQPASSLDIFATICHILQIELPQDRPYDGVNLLPYLLGQNTEAPHKALFWRSGYHKAVRFGDWKLIKDEKAQLKALYNIKNDKEEQQDLSAAEPARVAELEKMLQDWARDMVPPAWVNVMDYHIKDGERTYYFPL